MRVLVIGGGIGGLATAIALRQQGLETIVCERAGAMREVGAGITLWSNAIGVLRQLGVAEEIIATGAVLHRAEIRTSVGRVLSATDVDSLSAKIGEPCIMLHRAELLSILAAKVPDVRLGMECVAVSDGAAMFADGTRIEADVIVGADGIHSAVRKQLFPAVVPRYSGYTGWRGTVPIDGLPSDELHGTAIEWWGRGTRFGIVPIGAGRVYWFATANQPPGVQRAPLAELFGTWEAPVPAIVAKATQVLQNDIYDLAPSREWFRGRTVLLGDAIHATTPNMGQGAAQALESALSLSRALAEAPSVEAAFARYVRERQRRTRWITTQSWRIGSVATAANPIAVALRDAVVALTPRRVSDGQLLKAMGG
ncbi:MAG TPA: FAD-dependent monooxygenase [Thermoanaerobaculia bacterium]